MRRSVLNQLRVMMMMVTSTCEVLRSGCSPNMMCICMALPYVVFVF
jgi:hypothetical protein